MQIQDIRVGNYLYYKDSQLFYEVESISKNRNLQGSNSVGLQEHDGKTGYAVYCLLKDLVPITLSEEILIKTGFKKDGEFEALMYKDTPICTYWDGVEWVFKYGSDSDLSFAACEYVHQAQNLIFALTNTELSIQL